MARITRGDALAVVIVAFASGVLFASPALDFARGLSLDILTALRWQVLGVRADPSSSPTVVVAIDEETYQTPPFKGSPTLTWTREIGKVLTAVLDGGANVVGFDVIFPTSIEQSEIPFGDAMLGVRMRGFDRDFLRALASGAAAGKVVLGEIAQRADSVRPSAGQRIAVRQQQNIRALNVSVDPDDVVRRLPLSFATEGPPIPSMAVELAARARGAAPVFLGDGTLELGGQRFAGRVANALTLNFEGGADDIPTYSLADLRACADKSDTDFFKRQFDGKVVIIGTLLNTEDRKLTSKRLATGLDGARAARCALPAATPQGQFKGSTIAGVYIHATAVNNLLRGNPVIEPGRLATAAIAIGFAAIIAVAVLLVGPGPAVLIYLGLLATLVAVATAVFSRAVALPLSEPALAGFAALIAMIGYRFVAVDRTERFLRASFGLYLAPQVIEQMIASKELPRLGGEMRDVTVFFSDLVGFSAIAEQLAPDTLVGLMNEYLSEMTDIVESCGGYVDKYIGDSIVAVFGAPANDPDHATHAVQAALKCRDRLAELNRTASAFQGHSLRQRIGLNSGPAVVGNIGSRRRFNYTVMSDTVNLASRLEGANTYFATSILVSETTAALTAGAFEWRELDAIRVKGRVQPVKIFQPLALSGRISPQQAEFAAVYAEGLRCWRARDFAGAAASFARIAPEDPPAARFLQRAALMAQNPPGADWEAVFTLEGK